MVIEIYSWAVLAYAFGFFPIAYALLGKGDAGTAFKAGLIPGIVTILNAFLLYRIPDYLGATILGIAGMTFTMVGIAGFYTVQAKTLSLVVLFNGVFLVIYGLWIMYVSMNVLAVATVGLVVFLYGVACFGGGLPSFGLNAKAGGWLIALCTAINFILAISWQFAWIA
ncbi:MAG: hypothetical protein H3Z52_08610 [archaeon]|nr:hypothetical protein [archaeon]MCP8320987.1 hypothetical protein [archaeon]